MNYSYKEISEFINENHITIKSKISLDPVEAREFLRILEDMRCKLDVSVDQMTDKGVCIYAEYYFDKIRKELFLN